MKPLRTSDLLDQVKKGMGRLASAGLQFLHIGGKPVPAGRPKVNRRFGSIYFSKTYERWKKEGARYVQTLKELPTGTPMAVAVEIVCEPMKASKYDTPMGDVDNFVKGPLDLFNAHNKVWLDDRQVVFLTVAKRFTNGEASDPVGMNVWWTPIEEGNYA